ncbi:hypothetical protein Q2941_25350 [Bradyrhizobium sp. UFLA05-153]
MSSEAERVIAEASETIARVDRRKHEQGRDSSVDRWRREMSILEEAREAERQRIGFIERLHESTQKMQREVAMGLSAVGQIAEKLADRITDLEDQVAELRTKLAISEARITDLNARHAGESNDSPGATVLDLPNPLSKRRA